MILYSLILSVFFVINCFASEGSEIDIIPKPDKLVLEKKGCQKPIGCQLYKEILVKRNENTDDAYAFISLSVPEVNEVQDSELRKEVQDLAQLIYVVDKVGNRIHPRINPKSNRLYLPLMQEGNECVDFMIAKSVIEPYEEPNPTGKLGLLQKFNDMKNGSLYCTVCNTTDKPNIPLKSLKVRK